MIWEVFPKEFKSSMQCETRSAVAVTCGQFGNPGRGTSVVGRRYWRTCEGQQIGRTQCVCSELAIDPGVNSD